ncbi:hypothetical protein HZF24_03630 [Sedimentibacter hydroxybenzoicus DSM 7310]|uniref:KAP NTPase domain-containing protein n=1 Tax=Sedimentibacter hydroxybenzoicus DSM 7310 TaxID=1123245 RepID=A0A974GVM3_SEDHY|nr:P-loop NTPase fold protein [Sedimentibacter hydroxybenzoicus]NYB73225.1 hypothetical protein [Sedimentibacter hydroxybenzoicus DSM 7310]
MKERHFFAGSNASKGLSSYFESILNPEKLNRLYILKGGPGVGKSSFMKKFADKMKEKNYSVDYIHCASDNDSLDGIIIHELKVAFVDGTAPHTIDPVLPGAADEILNLGEFLDGEQLQKHKCQIIRINQNKSFLYKSAFKYFQAAAIISEEINSLYDQFIDNKKFNEMCNQVINKLFPVYFWSDNKGKTVNMFSEAYTANGFISYTPTLYQNKKVWAVVGEDTNYTSKLLSIIADEAVKRGYDIECCYRPLAAEKLQHLCIPEMNLMIISTENPMHNGYEEIFDIHEFMDPDKLKAHISEIENNLYLHDLLINKALDKLNEAKKQHQLLEVFYINGMDFDGVNNVFDNTLNKYI